MHLWSGLGPEPPLGELTALPDPLADEEGARCPLSAAASSSPPQKPCEGFRFKKVEKH